MKKGHGFEQQEDGYMRVQGLQSEPVRATKKFYLEKTKTKRLLIRFPETLASKHPCRLGWQYAATVGHLQRIVGSHSPQPCTGPQVC